MSLNNLSNRLAGLGRREEALAAIGEAVTVYRQLAAAPARRVHPRPRHVAEQPVGARLAELGRREEALAAIDEAVTAYRQLAAARPDAFTPDLAMSLNNLSRGWPSWAGARRRWPRSRRP